MSYATLQFDWQQELAVEQVVAPATAAGKRTRTSALQARLQNVSPVQRAAVPGAEASAAPQVEHWIEAAVRPDLQPLQGKGELSGHDELQVPSGGGRALPSEVQAKMEHAFSADFSSVRIHEGPHVAALGALAYTQGAEVHFAPGQYAPHTEKGQELLGHELAHTLQQAQGRVAATGQAKGLPINADVSLEREADEQGARAARGEQVFEGRATSAAAAPRAVAQRQAVIQRAIGFEFETGWLVDRVPLVKQEENEELKPGKPVPFKKKDLVSAANTDGFRLEADEAMGGRSELEIVIRPPVEENEGGFERLQQIMHSIEVLGDKLIKLHNTKGDPFPLSAVTEASEDDFTLVTPRKDDPKLSAGPQVTTGLRLEAVPAMLGKKANKQLEETPKFQGLIELIKQYVTRGTGKGGALNYPKIIAEPLLARTDFVTLLGLVEEGVQKYYQENPKLWVPEVLQLAGLPLELANEDILSRGVVSDENMDDHTLLRSELDMIPSDKKLLLEIEAIDNEIDKLSLSIESYQPPKGLIEKFNRRNEPTKEQMQETLVQKVDEKLGPVERLDKLRERRNKLQLEVKKLESYAGFTVGKWLEEILAGTDLLKTVKDAESLGEFGDKTEKVGPKREPAGIFEWRGDQSKPIPLAQWKEYALSFFQRIAQLNGH